MDRATAVLGLRGCGGIARSGGRGAVLISIRSTSNAQIRSTSNADPQYQQRADQVSSNAEATATRAVHVLHICISASGVGQVDGGVGSGPYPSLQS